MRVLNRFVEPTPPGMWMSTPLVSRCGSRRPPDERYPTVLLLDPAEVRLASQFRSQARLRQTLAPDWRVRDADLVADGSSTREKVHWVGFLRRAMTIAGTGFMLAHVVAFRLRSHRPRDGGWVCSIPIGRVSPRRSTRPPSSPALLNDETLLQEMPVGVPSNYWSVSSAETGLFHSQYEQSRQTLDRVHRRPLRHRTLPPCLPDRAAKTNGPQPPRRGLFAPE